MSKKVVVLSSGGLDSTTCVGIAVDKVGYENVSTVSIFYGQRHEKELQAAQKVANHYNVPHYEVDLSSVMQFSNCNLLAKNDDTIPNKSYAQQIEENGEGRVSTYVPFRNGLLLSSVAAIAMSLLEDGKHDRAFIYLGAHADDAAGEAYADCSVQFTEAMNTAIQIGTYNKVSVRAPFVNMTKKDIVHLGLKYKVPYELTHSCYEGERPCCGTCGTCIDRINAFKANGAVDPVPYKIKIDWEEK